MKDLELEVLQVAVVARLAAQRRDLAVDRLAQAERHIVLVTGNHRVEMGGQAMGDLDQFVQPGFEGGEDPLLQALASTPK